MSDKTMPIKFHFFDFLFTPYVGTEGQYNSETILRGCLQEIFNEKRNNNKGILINRNEGRNGAEARNMFVSSIVIKLPYKWKCEIALLRENRMPSAVGENYTLKPLSELGVQSIAETTHFYVDFSGNVPVVCCEYNHDGPRISDIEYYFRQISHNMLRISTKTEAAVHMKISVNEALESITDVLKFNIKARPQRLNYLMEGTGEAFVGNMNSLAGSVDPTYLKVEAFFRERGRAEKLANSTKAVALMKRLLTAIKNDEEIAEDFEDFNISYENAEGDECLFQLIKGKQEIIIDCPIKSPGHPDGKKLFELTENEFDQYLVQRNG